MEWSLNHESDDGSDDGPGDGPDDGPGDGLDDGPDDGSDDGPDDEPDDGPDDSGIFIGQLSNESGSTLRFFLLFAEIKII